MGGSMNLNPNGVGGGGGSGGSGGSGSAGGGGTANAQQQSSQAQQQGQQGGSDGGPSSGGTKAVLAFGSPRMRTAREEEETATNLGSCSAHPATHRDDPNGSSVGTGGMGERRALSRKRTGNEVGGPLQKTLRVPDDHQTTLSACTSPPRVRPTSPSTRNTVPSRYSLVPPPRDPVEPIQQRRL
ncbi:homeotic protein female sterile-like [Ischnura elegans]|uniref:homeotic protein female sterile-like n=1 Tax=Ischnura elegans TaxID=197161 RepID=UPI001ED8B8E6|nr:homeotic protein female sterile-like [Ischnura elegans]